MPDIHLIRVFLSSPGDVTEERRIALDLIERLPNRPAFREKVALRVIAWDKPGAGTSMRATLTPQEAINRGLPKPSECDIVVVLFWSRMGTPFTLQNQQYLSGTHWELLDALQSERPQTVIYRRTEKKLFAPEDEEGPRQYHVLEDFFKSELFYAPESGEIRRGINQYSTPDDFRQLFEAHFEELVVEILQKSTGPLFDSRPTVEQDSENIKTVVTRRWQGSPFPGLRAFSEKDAPIFFGRGREIDALVALARQQRFIGVIGASGSGKSSLVAAGFLPRLRANAISGPQAGSKDWRVVRFSPGQGATPFEAVAQALMEALPTLTGSNPLDFPEQLDKLVGNLRTSPGYLAKILTFGLKNEAPWAEILLFIDQFEELFTLGGQDQAQPFIEMLVSLAAAPRLRAIFTLRADFYHRIADYPDLANLFNGSLLTLSRPKRDALRMMIELPAEQAGLEFEAGLVDQILDDTGEEPGNLALMAYTLDELYQLAGTRTGRGGLRLTQADYAALGGVHGAIGTRAEHLFQGLPGDPPAKLAVLENVFRRLVTVNDAGLATRQRARLVVLAQSAEASALVHAFIQARLFTGSEDAEGQPVVELAHEALLRRDGWPRLADWIETQLEDLRLLHRLEASVQEWDDRGRAEAYLWPYERLKPVYSMLERLQIELPEATRKFIEPEYERLLPALVAAGTSDFDRRSIANRLTEIGEGALPVLFAGLRAEPRAARLVATQALIRIDQPAVAGLGAALREADADIRLQAVTALRAIGGPETLPALQAALHDADPRVRSVAAGALEILGGGEAAAVLVEALQAADLDVRWRAAGALGSFGEAGVRGLLQAMNDSSQAVRTTAENALGVMIDEAAQGALEVLRGANEPLELRTLAAEALGQARGAAIVQSLIEVLESTDPLARRLAAGALGAMQDVSAIPALLAALREANTDLRLAAIEALAAIGDAAAAPGLVRALSDSDLEVRWSAAEALGQLGGQAIPHLRALLQDGRAGLPARRTAAEALARIGKEAVPDLLEIYNTLEPGSQWLVTDALYASQTEALLVLLEILSDARRAAPMRAAAAEALGILGDKAAIVDLLNALQSPEPGLRACSAEALGLLGDARATLALAAALEDQEARVRSAAARALGQSKAYSAAEDLLSCLHDADAGVQAAAAEALAEFGEDAIPGLLASLQDPAESVRGWSTKTLIRIGEAAVPGLLQSLHAPNTEARSRAALALSEIGTLEALFGLAQFDYENGLAQDRAGIK